MAYQYLCESLLSILLDVYPEVELMDHMVILCLIFGQTAKLFYRGSNFSTSLSTLAIFWFCFYYSHPSGYEIVSCSGSDLHFPDEVMLSIFPGAYWPLCVCFWEKCLFNSDNHFLNCFYYDC